MTKLRKEKPYLNKEQEEKLFALLKVFYGSHVYSASITVVLDMPEETIVVNTFIHEDEE